ncbi:putative sodium-coupled neutral amino acid transporter 10 [Anopheles maculipalpis]|uniref:putative sodium-coupled neutral amino acid transporter 10 n=1 Tax=Anopheles maculipalpis TaxID=1496333 RepID=UPI002158B825|nr:putative sodium-coupled neutral amino acid transporter 10 [Anopheles maculipalpis]
METNTVQTVTLTNSIIGVGILSMPFCFQRCGIVLSIVLLLLSSYVTRLVCSYMVKSAIISRRKNFEQIAFYAFGSGGKLLVELCVVGYLLGTCIAYFVVVGDLGPQITAKILSMHESDSLRTWVMIVVTIVCIIPLGMLRNVDSLASVCTASLGFYLCLVLKVVSESSEKFQHTGWFERLDLWNWDGILQCMPIFTMALSCQMQIFEVYATMPTTSLDKMSRVIRQSTNICTMIYVAIGFFGYVAFNGHRFSGNILVDFTPSFASDIIKMGFVLSVAFSFPLAIFPCRVSLYSLLYKRASDGHMYIPESKFRPLTIAIVVVALIFGLLIPSIEVVIGLVGSTIGVAICLIIPAACYMTICKTNISEKQLAQVMIAFGFIIMVLGTYANLQAIDRAPERKYELTVAPPVLEKLVGKPMPLEADKKADDLKPQAPAPVLPVESVTEKIIPKIESPQQVAVPAKPAKPTADEREPKKATKLLAEGSNVQKPGALLESSSPSKDTRAGINNEAILKEEHEIAVEEKEKIVQEISELKNAKKVLEAEVENIKEELVKKNKETEQLVLKKLDEIVEKISVQKAGIGSREEEQQRKNGPELLTIVENAKQDPIPNDPIVKLLKAGGNNKSIPQIQGRSAGNDTEDKQRNVLSPDLDNAGVPVEGAGAGELPVEPTGEANAKRPEKEDGKQEMEQDFKAPAEEVLHKSDAKQTSQNRSDPTKNEVPPSSANSNKNVLQSTELKEAKMQPPVDDGKGKEKNVPLPPLPVEVPDEVVAEAINPTVRSEQKVQNLAADEAMAGKRDLLAMRLKREAIDPHDEPDNCPQRTVPGVVEPGKSLFEHTNEPAKLEKDGFR